jgi:hypothetical protein
VKRVSEESPLESEESPLESEESPLESEESFESPSESEESPSESEESPSESEESGLESPLEIPVKIREEDPKKIGPDKLTIKKVGDAYYVIGKPLTDKKIVKELFDVLGEHGKYQKVSSGGTRVVDKSVIKFRGDALEYNRKVLKDLGAEHPYSQGLPNRKILEIRGNALKANRKRLEGLGGKYPTSVKGMTSTIDTSRIKFPKELESKVKSYIFTTLSQNEKFLISYRDWIGNKASMFLDTALQLAKIQDQNKLGRQVINFTIKNIYRCDLSIKAIHSKSLDVDYEEIIDETMIRFSNKDEYSGYYIADKAKKQLAQYLEQLGELLVEPLDVEDMSAKTYKDYMARLISIEEWADDHLYCSPSDSFNSDQICIIRALQHMASCISKFTDMDDIGTYNKRLAYLAFVILLPCGEWRKDGREFINTVYKKYRIDMDDDEISQTLEKFGIHYNIDDIYSSLVSSHYDCGDFCPDQQSCEGAMVIFASALAYLDDYIDNPRNSNLRRRIRALAVLDPQAQIERARYTESDDSQDLSFDDISDEDEPEKKKKYNHRKLDTRDKRTAIYHDLLGDIPEISGQYDSTVKKLEDMNDTLRLKVLNKLIDMPVDEKAEYVENIKKMAVYLKEDIDSQSKRNIIYIRLIIDEVVKLEDYEAIVEQIEYLSDPDRLKVLNKWYNLNVLDRRKDMYKMLR